MHFIVLPPKDEVTEDSVLGINLVQTCFEHFFQCHKFSSETTMKDCGLENIMSNSIRLLLIIFNVYDPQLYINNRLGTDFEKF